MKQLLALVLIFSFSSVFSQNAKIDSLKKEIAKSKYDTTKIRLLNDLGIQFWRVDLDKSIQLGNQALKLADKSGNRLQSARSNNVIGGAYMKKNDFKKAYYYYNQSIQISEELKLYIDLEKSLVNLVMLYTCGFQLNNTYIRNILDRTNELARIRGVNYRTFKIYSGIDSRFLSFNNNNFDVLFYIDNIDLKKDKFLIPIIYIVKAFHYSYSGDNFRAIEYAKLTLINSRDNLFKMLAIKILAEVNFRLRRFPEAEKNCLEALKYIKSSTDPSVKIDLTMNEMILVQIYIKLKKFKEAYSLILNEISNNSLPYNNATIYCEMANIYCNLDSLQQAHNFVDKSIRIADSLKMYNALLAGLNIKYNILYKENQLSQIPVVIKKMEQTIGNVNDWYTVYDVYKLLSVYYKERDELAKSLIFLEKQMQINDTIRNKELNQSIEEFQIKYETEKKEQQILLQQHELQSKTRLLIIIFSAGLLVLIALILIVFLYNKRNQAYKQLVYQSIENASVSSFSSIDFNRNKNDEETTENKTTKSTLLSENQIITLTQLLDEQLKKKIFLEPDISLDKIADLCGTNRNYISNLINRNHELNFNSFINKLRIEESIKIMINEQNNVQLKNLYKRLGYNSYTVFNDAFKKHTGVTPKIFLNTIIQDKKNNQIPELNDSIDIKNQQTL